MFIAKRKVVLKRGSRGESRMSILRGLVNDFAEFCWMSSLFIYLFLEMTEALLLFVC